MLGKLKNIDITFYIETTKVSKPKYINFSNLSFDDKSFFKSKSNIKALKKTFDKNKNLFFRWFHLKSNYSSKFWWMSSINMKNNISNKYFDHLTYLVFLNDMILNNEINNKVVVLNEINLAYDFFKLLRKKNIIFYTDLKRIYFFKFKYLIISKLKLFFNILRFLIDFNFSLIINKLLPKQNFIFDKKRIKIFHLCMSTKNILNQKSNFKCDYFKEASNYKSNKFITLKLPWIFDSNIISKFKIMKKLNSKNIINLFSFIGFNFQFKIIYYIFKCFSQNIFEKNYYDIDITSLLNNYKYFNTSLLLKNYSFWSYGKILNDLSNNSNIIDFYDPFHMGISEVIQKTIKTRSNIKFYGYYHSISSESALGYVFNKEEINSHFFPDTVILNTKNSFKLNSLHQYKNKFISGPAIRQNFSKDITFNEYNSPLYDIFFILPLNSEFVDEFISLIHLNSSFLSKFKLAFKLHPKFLTTFNKIDLPKNLNYEIIYDDIQISIFSSKLSISVASGSFIDCLSLSGICFTYNPTFSLDWDFKEISNKYNKDFNINAYNFQSKITNTLYNYELEKNIYRKISLDFNKNFSFNSQLF